MIATKSLLEIPWQNAFFVGMTNANIFRNDIAMECFGGRIDITQMCVSEPT